MAWADDVADLDATCFAELSDDVAAEWSRAGVFVVALPVILDQVERQTGHHGIAGIERADVARISAADVARLRPDGPPIVGDGLRVAGALYVVHGEAWRDEKMDGRDWLVPVRAG